MTAPAWPPEATCGRCKWWDMEQRHNAFRACIHVATGRGPCTAAWLDSEKADLFTHRDHGCRAWEPKAA